MSYTSSCFKAYDIRGRVPEDLDESLACDIGRAYAAEFQPHTVVIGRDIRPEGPALSAALIEGLNASGVDVIDIGLCGTEEVYFQTFHRKVDGGIMITASHNPKGYNGMKLVREGARPISGDTGLFAIRDQVIATQTSDGEADSSQAGKRGQHFQDADKTAYIEHLLGYINPAHLKPLRIVANPGNGMAGPVMRLLEEHLPFELVLIQDQPDGDFPNGVPNPLLPENRSATAEAVVDNHADFGIAWDGDFDRCFFFDNNGRFIESYYLVGLFSALILEKQPDARIIHDPRLTWNTIELVKAAGGIPIQSKTGHAFIKDRMRREDAVYGGEMSAHHYFRDFAYCDTGMVPWLLVAELISRTDKSLAELVNRRMQAYPCSGEINYQVDNTSAVTERILEYFTPHATSIDRTDGVSLEFDDWRFNLRASNTEPLLRLNIESRGDTEMVNHYVQKIESLINQ